MSILTPAPREIQKYLDLLADTLRRNTACTSNREESTLARSPVPRAWSAIENMAHLRACSDLWSYSIFAMLAHDTPPLPLLDV